MPSQTQAPRITARDRVVTFEERGLWALLRLMSLYQSALRDDGSRTEGSLLLVFNVRTIPDPQGGFLDRVGTDAGIARVFIRLTLTGSEKDKALRYPDFPTRAPLYTEGPSRSSER
jgi:type VI secretion system protein ImpL